MPRKKPPQSLHVVKADGELEEEPPPLTSLWADKIPHAKIVEAEERAGVLLRRTAASDEVR